MSRKHSKTPSKAQAQSSPVQPGPAVPLQAAATNHPQPMWGLAMMKGNPKYTEKLIKGPTQDWLGIYIERDQLNALSIESGIWPDERYGIRML